MNEKVKNSSRRQFLAAASGAGATLLLAQDLLLAAEPDPQVAKLVATTIGVDMHSHVRPRYLKNAADAKPDPDIDLASQIRRSGFSAVCETYDIDTLGAQAPGVYPAFNQIALGFEDRLLRRSHMRRALTLKDLETAHAQHQPIIVQCSEGAQFLEGHLERVAEVYGRGLRILQIVHDQHDAVAPLGDFYTDSAERFGGLTQFGVDVVKECNRLGIVVDLAHGTDAAVRGALKATTQPLLITHSSLSKSSDSEDMKQRVIRKQLGLEVASAGGVVGVWWRGSDTLHDYVQTVREMVDALGADHVGIGTDSDITSSYILPYSNQIWPDQNAGLFYAVVAEMLKQRFSPIEIQKVGGGNFCRVFGSVTSTRS
jgi:membrane dipeptidase